MNIEHKYFIRGKIEPIFIANEIEKHSIKTGIGAHSIFLGQVRSDEIDCGRVSKIIYSAYLAMAEKEISRIREVILGKYELKCLHVYHSLGEVLAGEISFFVFGSMSHRDNIYQAIEETVNMVKREVPIWKKQLTIDS
ncbi:MAG: molybdenum cofactor biosynthesis protein MoaE [Ignavibacteria bacterium]